ncbi:rCG63223 [Rattus norvegicus]|uniref:RCG63223 n=1 Tax=Rattus norvegicus TaxID=10116 RepID=A6IZV1_RAT|nr:rCG63223 [Rattus norvegicus]
MCMLGTTMQCSLLVSELMKTRGTLNSCRLSHIHIKLVIFKNQKRGWRDGSVVKSTRLLFQRS